MLAEHGFGRTSALLDFALPKVEVPNRFGRARADRRQSLSSGFAVSSGCGGTDFRPTPNTVKPMPSGFPHVRSRVRQHFRNHHSSQLPSQRTPHPSFFFPPREDPRHRSTPPQPSPPERAERAAPRKRGRRSLPHRRPAVHAGQNAMPHPTGSREYALWRPAHGAAGANAARHEWCLRTSFFGRATIEPGNMHRGAHCVNPHCGPCCVTANGCQHANQRRRGAGIRSKRRQSQPLAPVLARESTASVMQVRVAWLGVTRSAGLHHLPESGRGPSSIHYRQDYTSNSL